MKISILKYMQGNTLYFREELGAHSKRIDFELSHLLASGEIIKHYHGIYSKFGSNISNESLIDKILERDRSTNYLIFSKNSLKYLQDDSQFNGIDYICLNTKRSDQIKTPRFTIKFQIPTHGFPKKITESFLMIYQMNISDKTRSILEKEFRSPSDSFLKDAKKFANKRTYKIISEYFEKKSRLNHISEDLSTIGAPLILQSRVTNASTRPLEKIIAEALKIGMEEPRIHNILPFTILKNCKALNFKKLEYFTKENGTYRYAGFILELLKRAGFEELPEFEAPKYKSKPKILFRSIYGARGINRLMTNHLDFAHDRWGILIDSKIDSEKEKIRKWL